MVPAVVDLALQLARSAVAATDAGAGEVDDGVDAAQGRRDEAPTPQNPSPDPTGWLGSSAITATGS